MVGGDGFALLFAGLQVLDRWPFGKNGGPIGADCWVFSQGSRQVGVFNGPDSGGLDDAKIGIPAAPQDALSYNSRADGTICESVDPANIVIPPLSRVHLKWRLGMASKDRLLVFLHHR